MTDRECVLQPRSLTPRIGCLPDKTPETNSKDLHLI
jgi:hypothetical protein